MKKLLKNQDCTMQNYLGSKLKQETSKNLEIAIAMLNITKEVEFEALKDVSKSKLYLEENVPAYLFDLRKERELNIETIASGLAQFVQYSEAKGRKVLESNVDLSYPLPNTKRNISKTFQYVFAENDKLVFSILKKGKQDLNLRTSQIREKSIDFSIEYYIYWLMAKTYRNLVYPNYKDVYVEVVGLTPTKGKDSFLDRVRIVNYDDVAPNKISKILTAIQELDFEVNTPKDSMKVFNPSESTCMFCPVKNICKYQNNSYFEKKLTPVKKDKAASKNSFSLTSNQEKLVNFESGIARVLASAGSGKTTTLAGARTSNLIKNLGYKGEDFLFLTFTERGVREIKEKIANSFNDYGVTENVDDLRISTFNGFAQMIITENYKSLGFTEPPKIIQRSERISLFRKILNTVPEIPEVFNYSNPSLMMFNARGALFQVEEFVNYIATNKTKGSLTSLIEEWGNQDIAKYEKILSDYYKGNIFLTSSQVKSYEEKVIDKKMTTTLDSYEISVLEQIVEMYEELKQENCYLEYSDQVTMALKILNSPKAVKYSAPHIVVDEFQDTDKEQIELIKMLIKNNPNWKSFVACGDDSQAIFSFRGATQDSIVKFNDEFSDLATITDVELTDNFRCNKEIVELSNNLNKLNEEYVKKTVKSTSKAKFNDSIKFEEIHNLEQIINAIDDFKSHGYKEKDICIIARTNSELEQVSKVLDESSIDYNQVVSVDMISDLTVRNILSFGYWIKYPENTLYFSEFFQIINKANLLTMNMDELEEIRASFQEAFDKLDEESQILYFENLLRAIAESNKAVNALLGIFEHQSFETITELASWLIDIVEYKENLKVEKDLTQYEAITLMTAHSCKGSEFPCVICLTNKFGVRGYTDEERRAMFVAITRAKEMLTCLFVLPKVKKNGKYGTPDFGKKYFDELKNLQ